MEAKKLLVREHTQMHVVRRHMLMFRRCVMGSDCDAIAYISCVPLACHWHDLGWWLEGERRHLNCLVATSNAWQTHSSQAGYGHATDQPRIPQRILLIDVLARDVDSVLFLPC